VGGLGVGPPPPNPQSPIPNPQSPIPNFFKIFYYKFGNKLKLNDFKYQYLKQNINKING
jgi:hypothetical protein